MHVGRARVLRCDRHAAPNGGFLEQHHSSGPSQNRTRSGSSMFHRAVHRRSLSASWGDEECWHFFHSNVSDADHQAQGLVELVGTLRW